MKLNFILPFYPRFPIGGFKVQYEYASRLAERGHQVAVIHSRSLAPATQIGDRIKGNIWKYLKPLLSGGIAPWFTFHPDVQLRLLPDLRESFIPDADITVATCWSVAEITQYYSSRIGKQIYIVYDYEVWQTASDEIRQRMSTVFQSNLAMVATSPAVKLMLQEHEATPVAYIPCGLDFDCYGLDVPISERVWGRIGFPARDGIGKGLEDAIAALELLKVHYGDSLEILAFGPKAVSIPDWVTFVCLPTDQQLRAFYNQISIFLFPSHYEGWGLPGIESLACGSALVASDRIGLRDYAIDGQTALVVPIQRPDLLARSLETLLQDDLFRQQLAQNGYEHVQQYTWEQSINQIEMLFLETIKQ